MTSDLPTTIYGRFSGYGQKAASIERQHTEGAAHAVLLGWSPAHYIRDDATSAYHGMNRREGAELHEFERRAKAGHFRGGHGFVCENLDRLSRQGWRETFDFIENVTRGGVHVASYHDHELFEPFKPVDMMKVIKLILTAERAREESETKAKRTNANWAKKHEQARNGSKKAISRSCLHWIQVSEKTGCYVSIGERAKLVLQIFEWAADGLGAPRIATRLNDMGVAVWGRGTKGWQDDYIWKLLRNRAVLGEYQPMRRVSIKPHREEPNGPPIPGLYPQVIDAALFNRVQAELRTRKGGGGGRGDAHSNIFQGVAKCQHCGGGMTYNSSRVKGRIVKGVKRPSGQVVYKARIGYATLRCNQAIRRVRDGNGALLCENKASVRYQTVEPLILDHILHLALDNVHFLAPDRVAMLEVELAELERAMAGRGAQVGNLAMALANGYSPALESVLRSLEGQQHTDDERIAQLKRELATARGEVSSEEHLTRVREVRGAMADRDEEIASEARRRVNQALKRIVTSMTCNDEKVTTVTLAKGIAVLQIAADGSLMTPVLHGSPVLRRKEYQLHALSEIEGNADRVEAVTRRADQHRHRKQA